MFFLESPPLTNVIIFFFAITREIPQLIITVAAIEFLKK